MREIKFRGKAINNAFSIYEKEAEIKIGDWVYGAVIPFDDGIDLIFEREPNNPKICGCHGIEVEHNTIGQFIGLHDKNGTEIYEGDLVSYIVATGGIEELGIKSKTCFVVQYNDKKAAFEFGFTNGMNEAYNLFNGCLQHHKLVVVGNIHDNPDKCMIG